MSNDAPGSVVHYFRERLAWSANLSDEPSWIEFYRSIWPDMISCVRLDGRSDFQLRGVDRVLFRAEGLAPIRIDEKKRSTDYGDILLEVCDLVPMDRFDFATRTLSPGKYKRGWATDPAKVCDFIVYAVVPAQRAYLLPFETLRLTLYEHFRDWSMDRRRYPHGSKNPGYWTINVAVDWPTLSAAMADTMVRRFGGGALALPAPVTSGTQTTFGWGVAHDRSKP